MSLEALRQRPWRRQLGIDDAERTRQAAPCKVQFVRKSNNDRGRQMGSACGWR